MIQSVLASPEIVRRATIGLGIGATLFGLVPMVAPRFFCRAFDLPLADSPAADVVVRSVSARDMINGLGIVSAAMHGGRVAPWILARAVADGTDAGAIVIAYASGARSPRFVILGAIALGATIADLMIYRANRSIAVTRPPAAESSPG